MARVVHAQDARGGSARGRRPGGPADFARKSAQQQRAASGPSQLPPGCVALGACARSPAIPSRPREAAAQTPVARGAKPGVLCRADLEAMTSQVTAVP